MQKIIPFILVVFLTACSSHELQQVNNSEKAEYSFEKRSSDNARGNLTIITKERTVAEKTVSEICESYDLIKNPAILNNGLKEFVFDCTYFIKIKH